MEAPSQASNIEHPNSQRECQICLNYYSWWRRPKVLDCQHICCFACLTQMWRSQMELRCPWCRCVTTLCPERSVSQLPDDRDIMATLTVPYTPVFIRLHSNTYYLPIDYKERATLQGEYLCRYLLAKQPKQRSLVPGLDDRNPGFEDEQWEREERCCKGLFVTRACLVVLLGFVLLLITYIVLQNMQ